jgi:hypothetical protein
VSPGRLGKGIIIRVTHPPVRDRIVQAIDHSFVISAVNPFPNKQHSTRTYGDTRKRVSSGRRRLFISGPWVLMIERKEPFKCDEEGCDKAFASAASLAVHKVRHPAVHNQG